MQVPATNIRKGTVLQLEDGVYMVLDFDHRTPGNKGGFVQTKLRNLKTGQGTTRKFRSLDRVETAFLDTKAFEYLYRQGDTLVFMDLESYEQIEISLSDIQEAVPYLRHNEKVKLVLFEGRPINIDLPGSVVLRIVETEPGIKGNSVTNIYKPAKLETGLEVKVPLFVNQGEYVRVDTRTGTFLERAAKPS